MDRGAVAGADCIVVGGGLCGMLTAALLRAAGAQVLLIERQRIGLGPPAVELGLLGLTHPWRDPLPVSVLAARGRIVYPEFLAELCDFTGVDVGYYEGPVLVLDDAERRLALEWSARHGSEVCELTPWDEADSREVTVAARAGAGLMVGPVPRVRTRAILQALRRGLELQGVELREGTVVAGLLQQRGAVRGVVSECGAFISEQVVLACGDSLDGLLRALWRAPAMRASDRELTVFSVQTEAAESVVACGGAVMMFAADGAYLENDCDDQGRAQARRLIPFLGSAQPRPATTWRLTQRATVDAVPCLGEHPELAGLFLNVGHGSHAGATGLPGGHLLLELMTRQTPSVDPSPYRVDR